MSFTKFSNAPAIYAVAGTSIYRTRNHAAALPSWERVFNAADIRFSFKVEFKLDPRDPKNAGYLYIFDPSNYWDVGVIYRVTNLDAEPGEQIFTEVTSIAAVYANTTSGGFDTSINIKGGVFFIYSGQTWGTGLNESWFVYGSDATGPGAVHFGFWTYIYGNVVTCSYHMKSMSSGKITISSLGGAPWESINTVTGWESLPNPSGGGLVAAHYPYADNSNDNILYLGFGAATDQSIRRRNADGSWSDIGPYSSDLDAYVTPGSKYALHTYTQDRLRLALAAGGRLFTSTNGGNTYTEHVPGTTKPNGITGLGGWPYDPDVLFAYGYATVNSQKGIWWTNDFGATWHNLLGDWESKFGTFGGIDYLVPLGLPGLYYTPAPPTHEGASYCPIGHAGNDEKATPTPISLRFGEKREEVTDITVQTPAGPLSFTRSYRQSKQSEFQFMGLGWTHNHHYELIQIAGTPNKITLRLPNGGEAKFTETSTDLYEGDPGSTSVIEWDSVAEEYTLTASDKSILVFDVEGNLLSQSWPSGEVWSYSYFDEKLSEIDDGYGRKLKFSYRDNPSGFDDDQLWRVGDHTASGLDGSTPTGRYVEFGYIENKVESAGDLVDGGSSLLNTVKDVRGNTWTYDYYGQETEETDFRQLNFLIRETSPAVDQTGDELADDPIVLKELTYTIQGTQLAVNGEMELDSDWTDISGAAPSTHERSNTQVVNGQYSRHVVASAAGQGIEGSAWDLVEGKTYIVRAQVYPVSGTVKMQVTGTSTMDQMSAGSLAWESFAVLHQPGADEADVKLQFIASGGAAEFYVDNVSIIESDLSMAEIIQARGDGAEVTEFIFQPEDDITTETTAGKTVTHHFFNGVYGGTEDPQGNFGYSGLNDQYRPVVQVDPNGQQTQLGWSEDGKHLTSVTDAEGHETSFDYNTDDTLNFSIDAEGRKTEYLYGDTSNPRLPTEIKVIAADETTVLRWQQFSFDTQGRTLSEEMLDPLDGVTVLRRTSRAYYDSSNPNGEGLLHTVTQEDLDNPANDVTTTYFYDSAGRVVQTNSSATFGSCTRSYTVFDPAGNVVASICNYENEGTAPTTIEEAVDLYDSGNPDINRVTVHEYDTLGRRFKTIVDAGSAFEQTSLTVFDTLNRVVRTIRNYVADISVPEPFIAEREAFDHGPDNTWNLVTDTEYNERGQVRREVDLLGNVTLYGYDEAGRLIRSVQSADRPDYDNTYGPEGDPELSAYVPA